VYTSTGFLFVGATIFTDAGLTTPYTGIYQAVDVFGSGVTFDVNNITGAITGPSAIQC
jgi:hypothetical protein